MPESRITFDVDDAITLFDGVFVKHYRTRLIRGGDEPLYLPADDSCGFHRVVFARGFFASALHEISHWCIAGARRRELEDYGYWYLPDGRDASQQQAFEAMEVKPQALEMLFSNACGYPFHVSVDNLGEIEVDREGFFARVAEQARHYENAGLPRRAEAFRTALAAYYGQGKVLKGAIALGLEVLIESESIIK